MVIDDCLPSNNNCKYFVLFPFSLFVNNLLLCFVELSKRLEDSQDNKSKGNVSPSKKKQVYFVS